MWGGGLELGVSLGCPSFSPLLLLPPGLFAASAPRYDPLCDALGCGGVSGGPLCGALGCGGVRVRGGFVRGGNVLTCGGGVTDGATDVAITGQAGSCVL